MADCAVLLGLNEKELRAVAVAAGGAPFVGGQLAHWLYKQRVSSFAEMSNVPQRVRAWLSENHAIGRVNPLETLTSRDGTQKSLFLAGEGRSIESALIPDGSRRTLCVSSQVGCRMGCAFCATGQQQWGGHLPADAILNQVFYAMAEGELSNIVFMGMGEPLDNVEEVLRALEVLTASWGLAMSPRRITVSTVGVEKGLLSFIAQSACHLAVSLHSPFELERSELVPANRVLPISRLMGILRRGDWLGQRRLSFEYVVLRGVNDSERHMGALARLLRGVPCLVNLIAYHAHEDSMFLAPTGAQLEAMREQLNSLGVRATVRASRGEDIGAACGLLSRTQGAAERQ